MKIFGLGDSKTTIGIDIGNNSIRVAQLRRTKDTAELINYGSIGIPIHTLTDGEVADIAAVSSSLKELFKSLGISEREVVVGIANQKVIVRLVDLPYMDPGDLKGALQYQAQDYIAIPVEEAILDFEVVRDYVSDNDQHMMEIMLVAAQKDMVYSFVDAIEGAGLEPDIINVSAFALTRSLGDPSPILPKETMEAQVIMDIGYGVTNIVVTEGMDTKFTRIIPIAGKTFTEPLIETFHVTFEEADRIKIELGLPAPLEDTGAQQNTGTQASSFDIEEQSHDAETTKSEAGLGDISVDDEINSLIKEMGSATDDKEEQAEIDKVAVIFSNPAKLEQAMMLLEQKATQFCEEARRSLDYYLAQSKAASLEKIILTGEGSRLKNLDRHIAANLQIKVEYGDPLKHISVADRLKGIVEHDKTSIAVCVGLALGALEPL